MHNKNASIINPHSILGLTSASVGGKQWILVFKNLVWMQFSGVFFFSVKKIFFSDFIIVILPFKKNFFFCFMLPWPSHLFPNPNFSFLVTLWESICLAGSGLFFNHSALQVKPEPINPRRALVRDEGLLLSSALSLTDPWPCGLQWKPQLQHYLYHCCWLLRCWDSVGYSELAGLPTRASASSSRHKIDAQ